MQDQNLENLTYSDLAQRVAILEATLHDIQRRRPGRRTATAVALAAGFTCLALWAQNSSGPITVRAPFRIVGARGQTILSVTETATSAGTLEMKAPNGKAFTAGTTAEGVPFGNWDATNGGVHIGTPLGKLFGVRVLPPGSNDSTISLLTSTNIASIMVGRHGVPKLGIVDADTSVSMGVLDSAGKNFLARLTDRASSGGDLEIANGAGQVVATMDSNPTNNEGRAVFTNASGTPLAKIGAAGDHGDVLLGGPNKAVAVWEMALTGMMH